MAKQYTCIVGNIKILGTCARYTSFYINERENQLSELSTSSYTAKMRKKIAYIWLGLGITRWYVTFCDKIEFCSRQVVLFKKALSFDLTVVSKL